MAGLYIESRLRPCWVITPVYINGRKVLAPERKKALFHMFITEGSPVRPSYMGDGHGYALVEFEDGHVDRVDPSHIQFCDNKMREYSFNEGEKNDLQRKSED